MSSPADIWKYQTTRIGRLEGAVCCLSLGVMLLAGIIVWYVWHGLPIHYIPPGGPGISQPGVIPDAVATDYASRWLHIRYTFTPSTVKQSHQDILPTLHPSLQLAFKQKAERDVLMIKEAQLSAAIVLSSATVTQRSYEQMRVALEAKRLVWIGGQQIREEPLHADITMMPWLYQGQPAGLVVTQISVNPALTVSGQ